MKEKELKKLFEASASLEKLEEVSFQQDRSYRRFFFYKGILAFILKNAVIDFKELSTEEIGGDDVFNQSAYIYEKGKYDGVELGNINTKAKNIMRLMKTMNISFEKSVVALEIDEKDIPKIKERMKEIVLN